jgi:hypothetical protein
VPRAKPTKSTQPKKAKTGYNRFVAAVFSEEKSKLGGGGDFGKVSKAVAERWRALSDSEKEKYNVPV